MSQEVTCYLLITEPQVQSCVTSCGIHSEKSGTGPGLTRIFFSFLLLVIIILLLDIHQALPPQMWGSPDRQHIITSSVFKLGASFLMWH
jgi:hypothetical protein